MRRLREAIYTVSRESSGDDERLPEQAALTLASPAPFVPRPNARGRDGEDTDEWVADLQ